MRGPVDLWFQFWGCSLMGEHQPERVKYCGRWIWRCSFCKKRLK